MVDVSVLRTRLYEVRFGYKKGGKFWRGDLWVKYSAGFSVSGSRQGDQVVPGHKDFEARPFFTLTERIASRQLQRLALRLTVIVVLFVNFQIPYIGEISLRLLQYMS